MIDTVKRWMYMVLGLGLVCLGTFMRTINGFPIEMWRRVAVIAGGLFFCYCGVMYYLPRHRRRREELNDLLDGAEREMNEHPESR
jgi:Flp pilus assembly protein TadB